MDHQRPSSTVIAHNHQPRKRMKNAPSNRRRKIGRPFQVGNPGGPGRPRGPSLPHQLLEAVQSVEVRRRKPLLEHFVERAYTSDRVLIALLKKFIPDLGQQEVSPIGQYLKAVAGEICGIITKYVPDPEAQLRLADELEGKGTAEAG